MAPTRHYRSSSKSAERISVAHSPDSDDYFFFWALRKGLVDSDGLEFLFTAEDTQALNDRALRGNCDVVAVSAGAYHRIADRYLVLPHGASVGRGYGPVVVARRELKESELLRSLVSIPGELTTAAALLRHFLPGLRTMPLPIEPFELVYQELDTGRIDAALLIHEGQLFFGERGYHLVLDLGHLWQETTSLPLPLGINVIRSDLAPQLIARISAAIGRSIAYALDHTDELLPELVELNRSRNSSCNTAEKVKKYLAHYANEDSRAMKPDTIRGLDAITRIVAPDWKGILRVAPNDNL